MTIFLAEAAVQVSIANLIKAKVYEHRSLPIDFQGHTAAVEDVEFDPESDGMQCCSVGDDRNILFWDGRVACLLLKRF